MISNQQVAKMLLFEFAFLLVKALAVMLYAGWLGVHQFGFYEALAGLSLIWFIRRQLEWEFQ